MASCAGALYSGVLVWNRVRMVKDPDTGKRVSRANPPEEWKREQLPALAIVEQSLFDAVQARKRDRSHEAPQRQREARAICCPACSNAGAAVAACR